MPIDPSTLSWWSLIPQHLDPALFTLFGDRLFEFGSSASGAGFAVRWYGVGYLLAFWTVWLWMKRTMRDAYREWFIWPFGFDPRRPELVEYRQVTSDDERPLRAFSFTRGGKGGLVYWAVKGGTPPLTLDAPGLVMREDGARRFVEADLPEAALAARFRAALAGLPKNGIIAP